MLIVSVFIVELRELVTVLSVMIVMKPSRKLLSVLPAEASSYQLMNEKIRAGQSGGLDIRLFAIP